MTLARPATTAIGAWWTKRKDRQMITLKVPSVMPHRDCKDGPHVSLRESTVSNWSTARVFNVQLHLPGAKDDEIATIGKSTLAPGETWKVDWGEPRGSCAVPLLHPDAPVHDRSIRHAPPAPQQLLHDPGQLGEPRRPGFALAVDGALCELLWHCDHPGTLRASPPQPPSPRRLLPPPGRPRTTKIAIYSWSISLKCTLHCTVGRNRVGSTIGPRGTYAYSC